MNHIPRVLGYPCGQDEAILPARDFSLGPSRSKISFWCFFFFHIRNTLLTKLVRSRWLDIALVLFINMQRKNSANIQTSWRHAWSITHFYYVASSVSWQDEPNRALWMSTRAGKMELACPHGISRLVPQDQRSFVGVLSHIINPLSTKLVRSRWLYIGRVLFLLFYGRRLRLGP